MSSHYHPSSSSSSSSSIFFFFFFLSFPPSFFSTPLEMKLHFFCRGRSPRSAHLPFLKKFTSKEIKKATDGFSMILGSDSHGTVYRARFSNDLVALVKKRDRHQQEKDTFYRELQLLGRLHHRHLISLKGFSEGHDSYLVFDNMENGSLKEYLCGTILSTINVIKCLILAKSKGKLDIFIDPLRTPLNWRTRLQIAIDVAAALEYLYYFCDPPVYDVSINLNNILLDEEFVAKLSDVGFRASDLNQNSQHNTSEDDNNQRSRDEVFQFGLLILELITGQLLGDEGEVVQWVQESGFVYSMHKMVDADLGDSYDSRELKILLVVARLCTRVGDERLISIPQILRYLQGKVES